MGSHVFLYKPHSELDSYLSVNFCYLYLIVTSINPSLALFPSEPNAESAGVSLLKLHENYFQCGANSSDDLLTCIREELKCNGSDKSMIPCMFQNFVLLKMYSYII